MNVEELAREIEHAAQLAKKRADGKLAYFIVFQDMSGGHNACASNMKPEELIAVLEAFVANLKPKFPSNGLIT